MIKNGFKKVLSMGLCAAMLLSLTGCGSFFNGMFGGGKNNKNVVDPALAKQNVYSCQDVHFDANGSENFSIISAGAVGNNLSLVVSEYNAPDYNQQVNLYTIDSNGSIINCTTLGTPDVSALRPENYDEIMAKMAANQESEEQNSGVELYNEDEISEEYVMDEYPDSDSPTYYESFYFNSLKFTQDGIVGTVEFYNYMYSEDGDGYTGNDVYYLCKWNNDGTIVSSSNINEAVDFDYLYVGCNCVLDNGEIISVVSGDGTVVLRYDANGQLTSSKELSVNTGVNEISKLIQLKNGKIAAIYYNEEYNQSYAYFDVDRLVIEDQLDVPAELNNTGYYDIVSGLDTDFIISTGDGVYKFSLGDAKLTKMMDYVNSDFEGYGIDNLAIIDEQNIFAIYSDVANYETKIARLTYVDPSTIPDKEILTMATYYLNGEVRSHLNDFNKNNGKYRIIISDYSKYATDEDYYAGITVLNNDILAGNAPDIICMNTYGLDYTPYAKKGLLADFKELIEKDEELSKNEYLSNVFEAYSINGKWNLLVPSFSYQTFLGSGKYFNGKSSWTVSEFLDLMKTLPAETKLMEYCSREYFISLFLSYNFKELVDVETGKCNLNSDEFMAVLEYAKNLPDEEGYEYDYDTNYEDQFRSGKVLLYPEYISELSYIHSDIYNYYLGDAVMIGFPSMDGVAGTISSSAIPFAIMKNGNVDGAWEFVRYFLTPDYQDNLDYGIPVLKTAFDKWVKDGSEPPYWTDEDGTKVYYNNSYYIDGVEHEIPNMSDAEAQEIANIIMSCNKSEKYNDDIYKIIEEEASSFFSGQKSAKEVTDVMQSRVTLYINENQ